MKKLIFIIFLICNLQSVICNLYAQQPTLEWARRYNGSQNINDYPVGMVVDSSGNVYVTGAVAMVNENRDYATIKYSTNGVQMWVDIYNGPGSNSIDAPVAIKLDKMGNVYVTGFSESTGFGSNDFLTIKYNTNGVRQWVSRYNSAGNFSDEPFDMAVDDSGNVYITGRSYNGSWFDVLTIKYNTNGDSLWVRRFNPASSHATGESIAVDAGENVYVAAIAMGSTLALIKYNAAGIQQWVAYNPSSAQFKVAVDSSGSIYVGCTREQAMPPWDDYMLRKYTASGVLQWSRIYNGPSNIDDELTAIQISKTNNIYITGYSFGGGSNADYATIAYTPSGDSVWVRRYNGTGNGYDVPNALTTDDSDNVYVIGRSLNSQNADDICSIKYTASGVFQWEIRYPGGGTDIKLDLSRNIYLFGDNSDNGSGGDLFTLKYNQPTGIESQNHEVPQEFVLYQNYPNPFNGESRIEYSIPITTLVNISVYDVLGRKIKTLINQIRTPGNYDAELNAAELPSGVYFYRLFSEGYSESKTMVVIK